MVAQLTNGHGRGDGSVQFCPQLAECERQIARQSKSDPAVARLRSRPGIGSLTADAIVATVGNARQFKNGRQFAASLGITPRQYGSGGKTHLGAITRRGDSYLRCLLVQGARCVLQAALRLHKNKPNTLNRLQLWMITLNERVERSRSTEESPR